MNIVEFDGCNAAFGADQPEYLPLPACKVGDQEGTVISCWKLDWKERLKVLFRGRVYLGLMTFGSPIQPQWMAVSNPIVVKKE